MWRKILDIWKSDNLLEQAWQRSFEMLEITHQMFLEAIKTLRETDHANVDRSIWEKDKIINRYTQEVRRQVLTHCTMQGPNELPSGLVLVVIVIDIERIGDYTKNMVDLAINHPKKLDGGIYEDDLAEIETAVKDFFIRLKTNIMSSDVVASLKLLKEYEWVNPTCDKVAVKLIRGEEKEITAGNAATLALYFRWLKRINSHLRNITTSIVNPFDRIGFQPENHLKDI
jgi:phosphate transport system protein